GEHVAKHERASARNAIAYGRGVAEDAEVVGLFRGRDVTGPNRPCQRGACTLRLVSPYVVGGAGCRRDGERKRCCSQQADKHDPRSMLAVIRYHPSVPRSYVSEPREGSSSTRTGAGSQSASAGRGRRIRSGSSAT